MKKSIFLLIIFLTAFFAEAQTLDRSKRPEPGPAREIKIGSYESFTLDNGLRVFVVQNSKLPRVSISLTLDYDPVMEGAKAGYVDIAGQMLKRGTTNRTKSQIDEEVDFMGASLSMGASGGFASGLSQHFEKLAEIMSDVVMNPAFPEDEFRKIMKQTRSGLEAAKDQPSFMMSNLSATRLYGRLHPYGEVSTEATLDNISLEDCIAFHKTFFRPNVAIMAVVGDINVKQAKMIIERYFKNWERADVLEADYPMPAKPRARQVSLVNRDASVQSNIKIANTYDLKPGDPDAIKLSLANSILGGGSLGRLFLNLREDKAYTYGAYSSAGTDPLVALFSATAEVRNEVTDSAVAEILKEIGRMRDELVPADELQNAKNYISGNFGLSLESPQTIARFAINTARYNLPKDYYQNYLRQLNAVTAEEIRDIARKYFALDNTSILVVGKAADIAEGLAAFGPVNYFDLYGQKTDAPNIPIPAGMTAEMVIENHLKAIGGRKAIGKIKTADLTYEGEIPQQEIAVEIRFQKINGVAMSQDFSITGMGTVQKTVFDGEKARSTSMQGKQDIEDEDLLVSFQLESFIFKPMALFQKKSPFSVQLVRMTMVDGKPAFVVDLKKGDKTLSTLYFDQETHFLIREEATGEGPQGPVTTAVVYGDFKAVNGLIFPHKIINDLGGGLKLTVTASDGDIRLNNKLNKKDFAVK
jgi:zinc protease